MALPRSFSKAILRFNQVRHASDEKRWKSFKFRMRPFNAGSHRVSTPLPAFSKKILLIWRGIMGKMCVWKWWGTIFTLNLSLSGKLVPSLTDAINFKLYLHYQVYACGDFYFIFFALFLSLSLSFAWTLILKMVQCAMALNSSPTQLIDHHSFILNGERS